MPSSSFLSFAFLSWFSFCPPLSSLMFFIPDFAGGVLVVGTKELQAFSLKDGGIPIHGSSIAARKFLRSSTLCTELPVSTSDGFMGFLLGKREILAFQAADVLQVWLLRACFIKIYVLPEAVAALCSGILERRLREGLQCAYWAWANKIVDGLAHLMQLLLSLTMEGWCGILSWAGKCRQGHKVFSFYVYLLCSGCTLSCIGCIVRCVYYSPSCSMYLKMIRNAGAENERASPFGYFLRRQMREPSLQVPRFNGGVDLKLSSVRVIKDLQLSLYKPQVQIPVRPPGEPPGILSVSTVAEAAFGDCSCGCASGFSPGPPSVLLLQSPSFSERSIFSRFLTSAARHHMYQLCFAESCTSHL